MAELLQELRISYEGAFVDAALSEADLDVQLEVVGAVIMKTYESSRNIELLEDAIRVYAQILLLRPAGYGGRVAALNTLGTILRMSCEGLYADKARLIRSISCHWEALRHRSPGHPDRANTLHGLGVSLLMFHVLYGGNKALFEAIAVFRQALDFCPTTDHITRADLLRELSRALQTQFRRHGNLNILIEALKMSREALTLLPAGDSDRTGTSVSDLAIAHLTLYQAQGNFATLEEAIKLSRQSLDLRPPGHPNRFNALSNLAAALRIRFNQRGGPDLLDEAIGLLRQAVNLCPRGHPTRGRVLNNLADALHTRFEQSRDPEASSEAIELYREVLDLHPLGHPDRHASLNNLAMSLSVQFKQQGNSQALTEAIALHRQALTLLPTGHPSYGTSLDNLATALLWRSKEQGDADALTEANSLLRRALELHPSRGSTLNNLAAVLYARFMDRENDSDISALAEVIDLNRQALSLSSPHNPTHHAALNNLASALLSRTEKDGDLHTLIEVIDLHRQALRLRPPSHFMRPSTLKNLGSALRLLYLTQPTVVEEELALAREGMEICGHGHPMQAYFLFAVGACLLRPGTPLFDSESGVRYIIQSLENPVSPARERLHLAIHFLRFLDDIYRGQLAEAEILNSAPIIDLYVRTIRLLPYVASVGRGHAFRLRELAVAEKMSRNAATRALLVGRKSDAVEMLEEGRGVFWSQALRIRSTALNNLPAHDRDRLYGLLEELETGIHTVESTMLDTAGRERLIEERRQLGDTIEALIASIRQRPGLERFLMPPAFSSLLQLLPHHGFVVMLVSSKLGDHALILNLDQNDARTLKLSAPPGGFLSQLIQTALPRGGRGTDRPASSLDLRALERALNVSRKSKKKVVADPLEDMLGALWTFIVKPVIDALELQEATDRQRPRVWWCATGHLSFLPIHAARDTQDIHRVCTSDYVVSSYIPTLSALIKAREGWRSVTRTEMTSVLVGETASGERFLSNVGDEVKAVKGCFDAAVVQVLKMSSPHTQIEELHAALGEQDMRILHLCCHGVQEADPLKSSFLLSNGSLTIEDIMKFNLPNAVLAFLSACQTAQGSWSQPDQAVHLAASMLFCGFRSVVGTMWSMADADGPDIARWFYQSLFSRDEIDLDDVAYALDAAATKLRETGMPASQWALLVHMGG